MLRPNMRAKASWIKSIFSSGRAPCLPSRSASGAALLRYRHSNSRTSCSRVRMSSGGSGSPSPRRHSSCWADAERPFIWTARDPGTTTSTKVSRHALSVFAPHASQLRSNWKPGVENMLGHAPTPLTASGLDIHVGHPAEAGERFRSRVLKPRRCASALSRNCNILEGVRKR